MFTSSTTRRHLFFHHLSREENIRRRTTTNTVLIFILGLFYILPTSESPAQDREERERKTKDFFGPRFEFHPPRPTRGERRHPNKIVRFRSIDGMNNNPIINNFGATGVNLRRRVPSAYVDHHGASGQDRPNVNPNISNIFATAAYRFGHSMLNPEIMRINNDLSPIADGHLTLRDAFFNPNEVKMHGIDPYLKGLTMQPSQEVETLLIDDVRNFLFGPPGSGGFDLASLNIQRGRDHGLPNYNTVRDFFRLPAVRSVEQITNDTETQIALLQAYGDVDSIDPWVGMLAEDHVPGASVGPTLHRIISQQFEMLRDADRFWYQLLFRGKALAGIESTKLSNVIYRNTNVRLMQRNVFVTPLGQ